MLRQTTLYTLFLVLSTTTYAMADSDPSPAPLQNGDTNGDGEIDISDVIYLLNFKFSAGPAPVPIVSETEEPCLVETVMEEAGITRAFVYNFFNVEEDFLGEQIMGMSFLSRNSQGVTMMFYGHDLPPGHAITAWWVTFANPEACGRGQKPCDPSDFSPDFALPDVGADALFADGAVVGEDGTITLGGHLPVGDTSGSVGSSFGFDAVGLVDPFASEIHVLLRDHGPVSDDPERRRIQLTTVEADCDPSVCGFPAVTIHKP